jgi:hypothetical protein
MAETPLRPAQAILADYANAIGGKEAWKRLRSVHVKRALTVAGQGATGNEEHWATADGKNLSVSTLRDVGTFRQATMAARPGRRIPCSGCASWKAPSKKKRASTGPGTRHSNRPAFPGRFWRPRPMQLSPTVFSMEPWW